MDAETRRRLIHEHLEAIRELEATPVTQKAAEGWPPEGYYLLWHVVVGMTLGGIGALVSLGANMIGAPLFGEPALKLIRVYLTFPMGEQALQAEQGTVLFIGCMLYLATGAIYGIGFHLVMSLFFQEASKSKQFVAATIMGLALWVVNFYLILSWLQPLLLGGNWIVRLVPLWVGALTHLAFAWTMLLGEFWGKFEAYGR
jgi:hypothetical protein